MRICNRLHWLCHWFQDLFALVEPRTSSHWIDISVYYVPHEVWPWFCCALFFLLWCWFISSYSSELIDWGWMVHLCVTNFAIMLQIMGCRLFWAKPLSEPKSYIFIIWTLRNNLQSNCIRNSKMFIQENVLENVVIKIPVICLGCNVLKDMSR